MEGDGTLVQTSDSNGEISVVALENSPCSSPMLALLKPSLADIPKIGYFSQDRASQTVTSEVVEVKELSQVIRMLLRDTTALKRDLTFTRQWMQTDFESKLQQKSIDLYYRINDRVKDIERTHEERMDTVRRAFRQQLADALKNVNQTYNRSMQNKLDSAKRHEDSAAGRWEEKFRQLQDDMRAYEAIIKSLQQQIVDMQENPANSDQLLLIQADADNMKQENRKLHKQIERLDEALDIKEQEVSAMNDEMSTLNDQLLMEKEMVQKFEKENDNLKDLSLKERMAANSEIERQRLEMERKQESGTRGAKEEVLAMARKEAEHLLEAERIKYQELLEQKILAEELLAKEKAKAKEMKKVKVVEPVKGKSKEKIDIEESRRNEIKLRAEVEKLKKEIERINRCWEKKFAILQQSMHALKDESYLRTSLQRQAAQLHQAAVTFSTLNPSYPTGIAPNKTKEKPVKRPLPGIPPSKGQCSPHGNADPRDFLSYTMSAPSGRGTELFSLDENQVMSDQEELPEGVVPLPAPPVRSNTHDSDSRSRIHSEKSHVVIMPAVSAQ